MATMGRMHLTIDVAKYYRLPRDVRVRFDAWLDTEALVKERIVRLSLAEGEVVVERVVRDEHGKTRLNEAGDSIVTEIARLPVRSLPPREAFE